MSGVKSLSQGLSEMSKFHGILEKASRVLVLSGAGISAESGVPTFRGSGGLWRTYRSEALATPGAFRRSPSLVWEFYHYRRELVQSKQPNKAHEAIAAAEKALTSEGKRLTVVTQNVDGLHLRAGSSNVIELHGNLFKTRCTQCGTVEDNTDSPIVPALKDRGAPDPSFEGPEIPVEELPHCKGCGGLLRPHIVWFGESLDPEVLAKTDEAMSECEACLVIGTSSVVYPAAMYAPALAARNIPVAEFNIEATPATDQLMFHFQGPCTETVPEALSVIIGSRDVSTEKRWLGMGDKSHPLTSQVAAQFLSPVRHYSSAPPSKEKEGGGCSVKPGAKTEDRPPPAVDAEGGEACQVQAKPVSLREKLKIAVRDYGTTVIVFHITHSLTLLGIIYLALSSGVDVVWLLEKVGLGSSSIAAGASTFVVAYAVNKVLAPVRISITLGATPFIVRYLRKIGLLKKSSPPASPSPPQSPNTAP